MRRRRFQDRPATRNSYARFFFVVVPLLAAAALVAVFALRRSEDGASVYDDEDTALAKKYVAERDEYYRSVGFVMTDAQAQALLDMAREEIRRARQNHEDARERLSRLK